MLVPALHGLSGSVSIVIGPTQPLRFPVPSSWKKRADWLRVSEIRPIRRAGEDWAAVAHGLVAHTLAC